MDQIVDLLVYPAIGATYVGAITYALHTGGVRRLRIVGALLTGLLLFLGIVDWVTHASGETTFQMTVLTIFVAAMAGIIAVERARKYGPAAQFGIGIAVMTVAFAITIVLTFIAWGTLM